MKVRDYDGTRHFVLRPRRTHKTKTARCACGWEGTPQPHAVKDSTEVLAHLEGDEQ